MKHKRVCSLCGHRYYPGSEIHSHPEYAAAMADAERARKETLMTKELVSIEAECQSCGDWVMVPGDEDPTDTLCVACAEARDNGEEDE